MIVSALVFSILIFLAVMGLLIFVYKVGKYKGYLEGMTEATRIVAEFKREGGERNGA